MTEEQDSIFFQRPDSFLTPSTTNVLPLLDPELVDKLGNIKEPWTPPSKTAVVPVPSDEPSLGVIVCLWEGG
ncbi:UNVERIFIED_CONTAM: hypothetical protein K2H54_002020 [Gekko kuhli]